MVAVEPGKLTQLVELTDGQRPHVTQVKFVQAPFHGKVRPFGQPVLKLLFPEHLLAS